MSIVIPINSFYKIKFKGKLSDARLKSLELEQNVVFTKERFIEALKRLNFNKKEIEIVFQYASKREQQSLLK
ncbi:MAG TPA: hypothetical protein PL110_00545 [Candidatus Eremiobacteraeota bacterium]|nr:hypothetical protein [Candidatus Eremiobacteraeota bacterium]